MSQTTGSFEVSQMPGFVASKTGYRMISTVDEYWRWLEESFVDNIRAQSWYNGDPPRDLNGFMNDKANRLIGWPVMRQLRIRSNSKCRVPILIRKLIRKCKSDYSFSNKDHQPWFPGWKIISDNISYSESIQNAFLYQSGNEMDSFKYSGIEQTYDDDGGGYIYEFRGRLDDMKSNLTKLHNLSWIDSQTRIVIIQVSLYNPNVELFTLVTFIIEFSTAGGVFTQSRFDPVDLHNQFDNYSSIFNAIFGLIYMLFIAYFSYIEIRSMIKLKKKYFKSIWSYIQWGVIICSWTGLGIYIWRFKEGSRLRKIFHNTNGYQYVNIQMGVYLDTILMLLFGFSCFFSTLKYLYLFRFNYHLSQFAKTLQYIQKDLLCFTMSSSIIFFSFECLFYSLFHAKILATSDLFHTAEMLFEMILLKFDSSDLYEADMFLGPFVFTLFIYIVVFICFTMFISIINDGFRHIREEKQKSKINLGQDVLLFMFLKIRRVLGLKKKNQIEVQDSENSQLRSPMDKLSDKIDQLVVTLNRLNIISSKQPSLTTVSELKNDNLIVEDL